METKDYAQDVITRCKNLVVAEGDRADLNQLIIHELSKAYNNAMGVIHALIKTSTDQDYEIGKG